MLSGAKYVSHYMKNLKHFRQGLAVYVHMSGLTFGSTYFSFGKSKQNHLSGANSVRYCLAIQYLEKQYVTNCVLTSNNAPDTSPNQITFTHHLCRIEVI